MSHPDPDGQRESPARPDLPPHHPAEPQTNPIPAVDPSAPYDPTSHNAARYHSSPSGTGGDRYPVNEPTGPIGIGGPVPTLHFPGPVTGYAPPTGYVPTGYAPPTGYGPTGYGPSTGFGAAGSGPLTSYGPPAGMDSLAPDPGRGSSRGRTPILITAVAVVVALLAAGGVYWFGFRNSQSNGGADTPVAAVTAMMTAVSAQDPIGVADQLDPSEAALAKDLSGDVLGQLKRLQVMTPDANSDKMTGSAVSVAGLTYDSTPEQINDHLAIVKLTGGTVTVTTDPAKLPFTDKVKRVLGASGTQQSTTTTIDLAEQVRKKGPFRIATVKTAGRWYPSILYTAADAATRAAGLGNPTPADVIAPDGAASPEAAMEKIVGAITQQNLTELIAVTPPGEMRSLHDYGRLLVRASGSDGSAGLPRKRDFEITDTSWKVSDVTGGKMVSLGAMTVTSGGQSVTVNRDGDSIRVAVGGKQAIVLDDATIDQTLSPMNGKIDPELRDLAHREVKALSGVGVVMVESDGKWFASPLRTSVGLYTALLKGLQPSDIDYLLTKLGR